MEFRRTAWISKTVTTTILLLVSSAAVLSQDIEGGNGQDAEEREARVLSIHQYNPVAITDPRFRVRNLNFERRYAMNGSGEFLDVLFVIENLTDMPLNLRGFVIAAYTDDAVDETLRQWIPYPAWRTHDFDRETTLLRAIHVSPDPIDERSVWREDDPDYFKFKQLMERRRNSVAGHRPIADVYPPLWKYIEYAVFNPNDGLDFTVYGDTGPTALERHKTNYVAPTAEELESKVYQNIHRHTYRLDFQRRETFYRSFHFAKYSADFRFYNTVAILIFDQDRIDVWNEQKDRELREGEEIVRPMVFKKIFDVDVRIIP